MVRECTFGNKEVKVQDLYTIRDVAARLDINPVTIASWIKLGLVPYIKLGNALVVSEEDIKAVQDRTKNRVAV